MIVLFIVIANEVLKCYGFRFCDEGSQVELVRLWQLGLVEVLFEGTVGGVAIKIWRRLTDKHVDQKHIRDNLKERGDKLF